MTREDTLKLRQERIRLSLASSLNAIADSSRNTRPRALDLLDAVEAFFEARDALKAAPTHHNSAFDKAYAEHSVALETLKRVAEELRRAGVTA